MNFRMKYEVWHFYFNFGKSFSSRRQIKTCVYIVCRMCIENVLWGTREEALSGGGV